MSTLTVLRPRGRFTRRSLLGGVAGAAAIAGLAGCSGPRGMATGALLDGELEEAVNIYSWSDYTSPDNLAAFSEETGIQLRVDSFGSNEELISKLGAARGTSGYDLVVPMHSAIQPMVQHGLLAPLDHRLIPTIDQLDDAFRHPSWDREATHSVTKSWGTTGFTYDTTVIRRELNSWADFLDATMNEGSRRTCILDDPWETAAIYFFANGIDPNTEDPKLLDDCKKFFVDQVARHIRAISSSPRQSMVQGDFALIQIFSGDARQGMMEMKDPDKWRFVYPSEGANLWADNWAIATGSQHPDAAHAFINFILDPEAALGELDYNGYPTGARGQEQLARENGLERLELVFPTPEVLDRMTPSAYNEARVRLADIQAATRARAGA